MMIPVVNNVISGATIPLLAVDWTAFGGIVSAPDMGSITSNTPTSVDEGQVTVTVTIPDSMALDEGGNTVGVGAVMAVYCPDMDDAVVAWQIAESGEVAATIAVPADWSGLQCEVFAFAKQVPNSSNGIPSNTLPWMYPAPTSRGLHCGTVTIA